ncbi:hypothetical protein FHT77_002629 [Rhizobium sp. BK181]|nr:hypothetical protein [Rhizobium sp. BK181]
MALTTSLCTPEIQLDGPWSMSALEPPDSSVATPLSRWRACAITNERDRDRHADESAGCAPHKAPEKDCKNNSERGYCQRGTAEPRLQIAPDDELDDVQARENEHCRLPVVELGNGKQCRKRGCSKRPEERDVVERESDCTPGSGKFANTPPTDCSLADSGCPLQCVTPTCSFVSSSEALSTTTR